MSILENIFTLVVEKTNGSRQSSTRCLHQSIHDRIVKCKIGSDCVVRGGVALACAADGCGSFALIVALFTLLRFFLLALKLLELVLLIVMSESLSDSLAFAGCFYP